MEESGGPMECGPGAKLLVNIKMSSVWPLETALLFAVFQAWDVDLKISSTSSTYLCHGLKGKCSISWIGIGPSATDIVCW